MYFLLRCFHYYRLNSFYILNLWLCTLIDIFLRVVIYISFNNNNWNTYCIPNTNYCHCCFFVVDENMCIHIFISTYYIFYHIPNGLWLVNVVVTTKLMFSYSFTRVNDEFYEGRGHKLSRTDGRCNSLRRWMVTGDGGNRDRPYTCKAKLNSCLVFAIKSASHRVERQFF